MIVKVNSNRSKLLAKFINKVSQENWMKDFNEVLNTISPVKFYEAVGLDGNTHEVKIAMYEIDKVTVNTKGVIPSSVLLKLLNQFIDYANEKFTEWQIASVPYHNKGTMYMHGDFWNVTEWDDVVIGWDVYEIKPVTRLE